VTEQRKFKGQLTEQASSDSPLHRTGCLWSGWNMERGTAF